jgi:hypothetical protein
VVVVVGPVPVTVVASPPAPVDPEVVVVPVVVPVAPDTVVPVEVSPPTVVPAPAPPDEPAGTTVVGTSELPQSTSPGKAARQAPAQRRRILFMTISRWGWPEKRDQRGASSIICKRTVAHV